MQGKIKHSSFMKYHPCPILMMYGKVCINFGSTLNVKKNRIYFHPGRNKNFQNILTYRYNLCFMTRFSKFILAIATYTFIVTVMSFVINYLSKDESAVQVLSSGIVIYGTIITIYTLLFHLLIVFVSFIIKAIKSQDNE